MDVSKTSKNKSVSQFLATFLCFGLFVYFAYHLMHGDRGYFALRGVEDKLEAMQARYMALHAEREGLENRVKMLRPASIDRDLLDERVRIVLGFAGSAERVILDK
jgi:cell division protein FtsB